MDEIEITVDHHTLALKPEAMSLRDALDAFRSTVDAPTEADAEPATVSSDSGSSSAGQPQNDSRSHSRHSMKEVFYEDATSLFRALMESNWGEAFRVAHESPEQVRTWVKSTGTENTTFDWSVWRRLPIHEACRRQAPAWMISTLLSFYPESAECKTHFHELPLHLAVGCGAAPEVVNLILVSHMAGIVEEDQSGRTPLEVWDESDFLVDDDHRVVNESLKRCHQTFTHLQNEWQSKLDTLKQQHQMTFLAQKKQHDKEAHDSANRQAELTTELNHLSDTADRLTADNSEQKKTIENLEKKERVSSEKVNQLTRQVKKLTVEKAEEQENVEALHQLIEDKDEEIKSLSTKVRKLTKDLQHIIAWYDEREDGLAQTQKYLQQMVDSYVGIHEKLSEERETIRCVMAKRGIDLPVKKFPGGGPPPPPPPPPPPHPKTPPRGNEANGHYEGEVTMGEAAGAALKAATAALSSRRTIPSPD